MPQNGKIRTDLIWMTHNFLAVVPMLSDSDDSIQIQLTHRLGSAGFFHHMHNHVVQIRTKNLRLIAPLCRSHWFEKHQGKQSDLQRISGVNAASLSLSASVFASLSIPFSFSPPFSAPSPLPPLPAPGSLYLYPFQSEGSQSVSDLSSLIPTFKPAALKSLFDITRELSFSPLYLSADEDPPKSHLALLGKHFPLLSPR